VTPCLRDLKRERENALFEIFQSMQNEVVIVHIGLYAFHWKTFCDGPFHVMAVFKDTGSVFTKLLNTILRSGFLLSKVIRPL
jgi:hypothetical protein